MTASRRLAIIVTVGIVAVGAMLIWRHHRVPPSSGLSTTGGAAMSLRLDIPSLLQGDRRWADQHLGNTTGTLGSEGCTVCSLSMALSFRGIAVDPPQLNELLMKNRGFTESGMIIWKAIQPVSDGRFTMRIIDRPTHDMIDAQLAARNPVLAKVLFQNRIWHWVLISGKEGTDYLMNDPLGSGQMHESMRDYPGGVFAIRYLETL